MNYPSWTSSPCAQPSLGADYLFVNAITSCGRCGHPGSHATKVARPDAAPGRCDDCAVFQREHASELPAVVITARGRSSYLDIDHTGELLLRLRQRDLSDAGAAFADQLEAAIANGNRTLSCDGDEAPEVFDVISAWLAEQGSGAVGEPLMDLRRDLAGVLGLGENGPTGGTRFNPKYE